MILLSRTEVAIRSIGVAKVLKVQKFRIVRIKNSFHLAYGYSGDLSSKLVWYLNGPEQLVQKVVRYSCLFEW